MNFDLPAAAVPDKVNTRLEPHSTALFRQYFNLVHGAEPLPKIAPKLSPQTIGELRRDYLVEIHPAQFLAAVSGNFLASVVNELKISSNVQRKNDRVAVRSFSTCTG